MKKSNKIKIPSIIQFKVYDKVCGMECKLLRIDYETGVLLLEELKEISPMRYTRRIEDAIIYKD